MISLILQVCQTNNPSHHHFLFIQIIAYYNIIWYLLKSIKNFGRSFKYNINLQYLQSATNSYQNQYLMAELCKCPIACCFNFCLCECNPLIFPAPNPTYSSSNFNKFIKHFQNTSGDKVPYFHYELKNSEKNIIFFHGNAEDIGNVLNFVEPIALKINASIFAVQYPTYGQYSVTFPIMISNKIKSDSLQFFDYLLNNMPNFTRSNTIIIGRSIGSGGASYLASRKNLQHLILISPFSTIPNVSADLVRCAGKIVKCHFDNSEQIQKYKGRLLVIHGESDQVINVRHGKMLVEQYRKQNFNSQFCVSLFPKFMSHNHFDYDMQIAKPIVNFIMDGKAYDMQ